MDTAPGLGFRHTLDPMHAGFKLEPGKHISTADGGGGFLIAADPGF